MLSSHGRVLVHGVQFFYTDYEKATVSLTQFYVMQAVQELYPEHNPFLTQERTRMFDLVCGTEYVRKEFGRRLQVEDILDRWTRDVDGFKTLSRQYYLYQ